jgi:hypothetical protein
MSQLGPGQEEDEIEEAFGLFRKAQKMINLGNAFSKWVSATEGDKKLELTARNNSDPIHFSLAPVFEPIVKLWLDKTALKTKQWADQVRSTMRAISKADQLLLLGIGGRQRECP